MTTNPIPVRDEMYAIVNNNNEIRLLHKDVKAARLIACRMVERGLPHPPFRVVKVVVFEEEA